MPDKEDEIRSLLREDNTKSSLESIYNFVIEANGVNSAKEVLKDYIKKGEASLSPLPDSIFKNYILSIIEILNM